MPVKNGISVKKAIFFVFLFCFSKKAIYLPTLAYGFFESACVAVFLKAVWVGLKK
jgi:hypothetical protein